MTGLAWNRPDIARRDVACRTISHPSVVHQRARTPAGANGVTSTATGAGHRGNRVRQRTGRRAGNGNSLPCGVMASHRCAVTCSGHTRVAVGRQPGIGCMAYRTLSRANRDVTGLARGGPGIASRHVASRAIGHPSVIHQRPRTPRSADRMTATA